MQASKSDPLLVVIIDGSSISSTAPPPTDVMRLSTFEQSFIMSILPSITTMTTFQGAAAQIAPYLAERIAAIVALNPWLGGRLVMRSGETIVKYGSTQVSCFTSLEDGVSPPALELYPTRAESARSADAICVEATLLLAHLPGLLV